MKYGLRPFILRLLNVLIYDPSRYRYHKRAKIEKRRQRTDKREAGKRKPKEPEP